MKKSTLLPEGYKVDGRHRSWGQFFYHVTLKDGRQVALFADKVLITNTGDFLAVTTSEWDFEKSERVTFDHQKTTLALAKGEWLSYYSASIVDGSPLGIDWVDEDVPNLETE